MGSWKGPFPICSGALIALLKRLNEITLRIFLLIFPPSCIGSAGPFCAVGGPHPCFPSGKPWALAGQHRHPHLPQGPGRSPCGAWSLVGISPVFIIGVLAAVCRAHRGPWRWGKASVLFPLKYGAQGIGCCPGRRVLSRVLGGDLSVGFECTWSACSRPLALPVPFPAPPLSGVWGCFPCSCPHPQSSCPPLQ